MLPAWLLWTVIDLHSWRCVSSVPPCNRMCFVPPSANERLALLRNGLKATELAPDVTPELLVRVAESMDGCERLVVAALGVCTCG